jgi:hypothetical protein
MTVAVVVAVVPVSARSVHVVVVPARDETVPVVVVVGCRTVVLLVTVAEPVLVDVPVRLLADEKLVVVALVTNTLLPLAMLEALLVVDRSE